MIELLAAFPPPEIPRDAVMPDTVQTVQIILNAVCAAAAIGFLGYLAWKKRDPVPIYLLIGGGLAITYEALGDSLVLAYYPEVGQETWVSLFGRDIPLFTGLLYFWYMCPFVVLFAWAAEEGFTVRRWWTLIASSWLFVALYEVGWMALDNPWLYYGEQAMVVLQLPAHVPFTYTTFLLALGAGIYGLVKFTPPKFHWLVIPAVPVLLTASHAAASLPAAAALYSTDADGWILVGSLLSIALSVLIWWAVSQFFLKPARGNRARVPKSFRP